MYTTIMAVNIENSQEQAVSTTILMGNAGSIYVSQSNIYLTDESIHLSKHFDNESKGNSHYAQCLSCRCSFIRREPRFTASQSQVHLLRLQQQETLQALL